MTTSQTAPWSPTLHDEAPVSEAVTRLHLDTAECLARLEPTLGDRAWPRHPGHALLVRLIDDLLAAGVPVVAKSADTTGGVRLQVSNNHPTAVSIRWTTHVALLVDDGRRSAREDVELLLRFALDDILCALGWQTEPDGADGALLVTSRMPAADNQSGGPS